VPSIGRVQGILFDLDGTLVDTAPDLIFTLNEMRRRRNMDDLEQGPLRAQASHGTQGLIRLGFGIAQDHADFPVLRQEFLEIYVQNLSVRSKLFPRMEEVLDALEHRGLPWAVVTNKPAFLTEPLLQDLGLMARAACVVSGDTCAHPKPHPAPVLHACREMDRLPGTCLYVGDAARDVAAAFAAGMPSVVARYGYLSQEDQPEAWGAVGFIDAPDELLAFLDHD